MKKFLILSLVSIAIFAEPSFYDLVTSANTATSNSQTSNTGLSSNLFAENPACQSKSSTYLELIKNWFNPQSDTVVTEVIEEPFVSPNKSQTSNSSWWSNSVGEKPGFFARIANRLLGYDSSSLNNYLESPKKPGVLENMFKQTKDLMQNNPELVNKVQDYLMSNPQVFEKMGQILKDNPGLVNSLL